MKGFIVALLAIPAALAAPAASAAPTFPFQSDECTCMNAAGVTRSSGYCHWLYGLLNSRTEEWCHRASVNAPELKGYFTDEKCAEHWGPEWNKGVCRTTLLCQDLGGPDYYKIC